MRLQRAAAGAAIEPPRLKRKLLDGSLSRFMAERQDVSRVPP